MKRVEQGGRETGEAEGQAKELPSSTDKARQRVQLDIEECVRFGDASAQTRDEDTSARVRRAIERGRREMSVRVLTRSQLKTRY